MNSATRKYGTLKKLACFGTRQRTAKSKYNGRNKKKIEFKLIPTPYGTGKHLPGSDTTQKGLTDFPKVDAEFKEVHSSDL